MNHEESKLQQACVSWFRAQYPQYAMLLVHPINEGSGHTSIDRRRQGIHRAEGAVAGVPDLILFMTSLCCSPEVIVYTCLGLELKTKRGKQSQEQKDFQKMFEAAGNKYEVIRSFDEFKDTVNDYIGSVMEMDRRAIAATHVEITKAAEQREKEKFYKIINGK